MLEFRTLGTVDLQADDGRSLRSVLAHPKRVGLLAFLTAVHPPRPQRRATLTTLLWPELDDAHARGALRQELYLLRRSLGDVLVGAGEDTVGVDEERLWCDARAFEAALDEDRPARALELYRGDFLPGLHVDGGEFERWVDEMRAHLARRAAEAARRLAEACEKEGDLAGALSWARRLLEVAPYDEPAWRDVIRLLDRSGDRAGAL
ncbi:MAG: BTAD domain-containing putative transcriptional regulator, partial [Gemmatimonadota bacterium]